MINIPKDETVSEAVTQYKGGEGPINGEQGKHYTYADYCTWDDKERWELIEGVPYKKSEYPEEIINGVPCAMGSPSPKHQEVLGEVFLQLRNYLKGKSCKVFMAPFDVYLNTDEKDKTVVEPDVLVICDKSKLTEKGAEGAPDMTVEILSPSSIRRDRLEKLQLYEQYGVREYWIIDPDAKVIHVHELKDGYYLIKAYAGTDDITVGIFEDCTINLSEVLAEE